MKRKIAIPVDDQEVLDAHFGHCKFFMLMDTDGTSVTAKEKVVPPPHEPGLLPKWLSEKGVTDILAGGMGHKAINLFNANKVNAFVGAPQLAAEELVAGFLAESLSFKANYCDH